MKKNIQEENVVYGIDFGSSSLKISVCEMLDIHDFEVLESMNFPYITPMVKKQFDRDRIKHLIDRSVNRIDRELSVSTSTIRAVVTLPMAEYKTEIITVEIVVKNNVVKFEHKIELINKAKERSSCGAVLHTIPLKYILDGDTVSDPVGLKGDSLIMDIFVIGYDEYLLEQFKSIFEELSINVGKYVAPPLSFINYYLNFIPNQNKSPNLLVLDFGADVSYCYRVENSQLSAFQSLSLGSEIITNDIKIVLKTSYETAKKLNEKYSKLNVNQNDKIEEDGVSVKMSLLSEIIECRYDEILEQYENNSTLSFSDGDDIKIILLGNGHPQGAEKYLENKWNGEVQPLQSYISDTNYIISIGNIQYALNNEIYIPQVIDKPAKGFIKRLIQRFEDLF